MSEACVDAIRDAGLGPADIDGICGSMVSAQWVQAALGIPGVAWFANPQAVIGNQITAAVAAVSSGMADTVLVYHHAYRLPWASRSAAKDPMRKRATLGVADARSWWGTGHNDTGPNSLYGAPAYAAWAGRYLHDYGYTRETLGLIAINSRTNAARNPNAVYTEPLTMEAYLAGRMVRDPLSVYDMDIPIDGADAFVITTTERARDLPRPPVLIHAATLGHTDYGSEEQLRDLDHAGQMVVVDRLWAKSDLTLADVDVLYPYEGFSNIALSLDRERRLLRPGRGWGVRGRQLGGGRAAHRDPRPDPGEHPRGVAVGGRHPGRRPPPRSLPPAPGRCRPPAGRRRRRRSRHPRRLLLQLPGDTAPRGLVADGRAPETRGGTERRSRPRSPGTAGGP